MAEVIVVDLENGGQLYFGASKSGGLREVSASDEVRKMARGQFEKALGSLGALVATLESQVASLPARPGKVELEFGASLSGKADLWIVSGDGKAEFKVKLTWENKPAAAPKA